MTFKRKTEDFVCARCGKKVHGTGYTNHCPDCLYSKHVDVNPGDREAICGGMMEPVNFEIEKGKYVLIHRCQKCGAVKKNKMLPNDSFDILPNLSESVAKKTFF
ncbi:MAG: RNHCP domain-containing protein [Candidatus Doudnabacteria bacterium]|nr:RNHCP domain-containing protein [Candidatus Doudnabacteria bacterium]